MLDEARAAEEEFMRLLSRKVWYFMALVIGFNRCATAGDAVLRNETIENY